MVSSALLALGDLLSADFRSIVLRAVGLTLALFVALFFIVQMAIATLVLLPWPWAETMLAVGTGLVLLVAFFFLMAPVAAVFAGLFLDAIAEKVERRHYPGDRAGQAMSLADSLATSLQFAAVVLVVNILALPLVFTGIGAAVLVAANAYLIGREYFELAASRHMSVAEARALRRANAPSIFMAGLLPALFALVPLLNLLMPLFATSYFIHVFKRAAATSA
jgi:CysZ protein